jgi:hypothetical protein
VLAALSLPRAAVLLEFTCVEGGQGSAPGSGLTLGRVEDAFAAAGFAPAQRLRATDETQQYAPEVAAGAFHLRLMHTNAATFSYLLACVSEIFVGSVSQAWAGDASWSTCCCLVQSRLGSRVYTGRETAAVCVLMGAARTLPL